MSSPAGVQYSQAEFLARWVPSSTRAGVILNPCPDLTGSIRRISALGSVPPEPDDSFVSDFAPLSASADSSCLDVDGFARLPGGEMEMSERLVRISHGQVDSLDEVASKSQDLPLTMKLEQLRKWQQHMQEQLKAHQLEELLCLQEEQQRLMNQSQLCMGDNSVSSGLSGAEESSLQGPSHLQENPHIHTINCHGAPQGSACGFRQEHHLSRGHERLPIDHDHKDSGGWNSKGDGQEQSVEISHLYDDDDLKQSNGMAKTKDNLEEVIHERPIKPGIGGQMQTFEELLEEQLRLEEQRLKISQQQKQNEDGAKTIQVIPKRSFLKRGEGLSRFTNNSKAVLPKMEVKKDSKLQPQAKLLTRSNSEPVSIQKGGINRVQRLPVQRKTAILNKENQPRCPGSPPQDIRVETKTAQIKVLGSHQRQNTAGSVTIQTELEGRHPKQQQLGHVMKPGLRILQPNPVTKQVVMFEGLEKAENDALKEKSASSLESEDWFEGGRGQGGMSQEWSELSFQEKLHRWECDRQLENMELGEFELLEQAAEELSFSSNSSFVMKVLQMDKQHRQLQAARGLHQRRLSSTPIKSPLGGALKRCSGVGSTVGLECKTTSMNAHSLVVKVRDDMIQDSERKDSHENSEFEGQEIAGKPPLFPSTLCLPAQSNALYDKRSYQDEESCRDSSSNVTLHDDDDDDDEIDSIISNADESTLLEDINEEQRQVVFDDDDTWNDLEDTPVGLPIDSAGVSPVSKTTANGVSPPERTLLRKVAVSKVVEPSKAIVVSSAFLEPDPPLPTSQLMTRLFPSLKQRGQNAPLPPPVTSVPESAKSEEETGQQIQSRQLRERLAELEIEIERFKKENAALVKLRQETEKKQENLSKESLEFEQMKAEELAKFEEYKKEENRKLQRERKLFEKHVSAARAIPDKKEREEIQVLKQQLSSLQEELRRKESRWTSTHSRLRQQIDSLSQENSSLRDEIHMLEKLRLSALKNSPDNAEKDKGKKDGPRMFENIVPAGIKAVKFASPIDSRGGSSGSSPPPQSSTAAASGGSSQGATAGIKSSLRRPTGPGSSSSSSSSLLPRRRTDERPTPASQSQEKLSNHEQSDSCSLKRNLTKELEHRDVSSEPGAAQEVITHPDGKTEAVLASGDRLIIFPNGTRKEVSADGLTVKVTFFNGDTKQVTSDQRVIYYYADAKTTHITYPDGMEVLHFPSNQTEKHFPDGRKEITFPDQTVKNLFPDGREESVLMDGTIIQVKPDGTKEILFNTGQKEIHTADYKRREYPDGTVKTVYTDGRQETRYPNGRLRIKDKDGNVTLDNRV